MILTFKIKILFLLLFVGNQNYVFSNGRDSSNKNYFPIQVGNTWQYRSFATGEIVWTAQILKDSVASDGTIFAWTGSPGGSPAGRYMVDTSLNLILNYNLNTREGSILFQMNADSGQSWIYNNDIYFCIVKVYKAMVFNTETVVKKVKHQCGSALNYGNSYYSKGFGLTRRDIEPFDVHYLSGGYINGVSYGIILNVEQKSNQPMEIELKQNYPNPFNSSTILEYSIPELSNVNISILDYLGKEIVTVVNKVQNPGYYSIAFNATNLASGVYYYRIYAGNFTQTKKMILMR